SASAVGAVIGGFFGRRAPSGAASTGSCFSGSFFRRGHGFWLARLGSCGRFGSGGSLGSLDDRLDGHGRCSLVEERVIPSSVGTLLEKLIEYAHPIEQDRRGLGRLSALQEPVQGLLTIDLNLGRLDDRVVCAEHFDESTVSSVGRICNDDPIKGVALRACSS
ncbi:MAG: hypothetical protein UZ18_ATM001002636, partial [Armatimonadetes bacterium OLB18]